MFSKLIVASHNLHKIEEIKAVLDIPNLDLLSLNDLGYNTEIIESGSSLKENALIKAETIFKETGANVLSDDSGLEVEFLNGAPGVYSARYAGPQKLDDDNVSKLLLELEKTSLRNAHFRTVLCLFLNGQPHFFEGKVHGVITHNRRGQGGFGYDPVFKPNAFDLTFAEMTSAEKNSISHRKRALEKLATFIKEKTDL